MSKSRITLVRKPHSSYYLLKIDNRTICMNSIDRCFQRAEELGLIEVFSFELLPLPMSSVYPINKHGERTTVDDNGM